MRPLPPILLILVISTVLVQTPWKFSTPALTIPAAVSSTPTFKHIVIILMENNGIREICGGAPPPCNGTGTPYLSKLANTYGMALQYKAISHPSQPNYMALLGADTFGCTSDGCSPVTGPNLVDRLELSGFSWKGYMEDYSGGCNGSNLGHYNSNHNPFVQFRDILNNSARCNQIVNAGPSDKVLLQDLASNASAPNYMWLTPNLCNDMHDSCNGQPQTGDNYLSVLVPQILNSTLFKTTNSALFITFDEGNNSCPLNGSGEDCVYTVWAGPVAKKGFASSFLYSHYSLLATIEKVWNLKPLGSNDGAASPMTEFLLPLSPDIDGDGKVDIADLVLVASAFGKNSTMAGYVSRYDLNQDGVIDIQDLALVAASFGMTT